MPRQTSASNCLPKVVTATADRGDVELNGVFADITDRYFKCIEEAHRIASPRLRSEQEVDEAMQLVMKCTCFVNKVTQFPAEHKSCLHSCLLPACFCVPAYLTVRLVDCLSVSLSGGLPVSRCIRTYIHTYIHAYIHT
jgi:hypothetical protein